METFVANAERGLVAVTLLAVVGLQCLAGGIVRYLNQKVRDSMDDVMQFADKEGFGISLKVEEIEPFKLVNRKKKKLGFITKIIAFLEISLFVFLTVVVVSENKETLSSVVSFLGAAIAGWLAIKIFGGYQQWSGPVFGRATFYIFLIGSLINILGAIVVGWSAYEIHVKLISSFPL